MIINYKHDISVEDYNFLRKSVGWTKVDTTQAQTGISNSSYLVTAVHMNKTIGLVRVVGDGGYSAIIEDVIVLPDYQGIGVGKCLLQKVMEFIKGNLKEGQSVFVNLMSEKGKESFYKQFGFTQRPNEVLGCGMTQWIRKSN
jgi:GNAT superfamily N-acetyltransferase